MKFDAISRPLLLRLNFGAFAAPPSAESALGGGCTTSNRCVPGSRCKVFFDDKITVPCEPSEVGVYIFRSGRPNAPLLSLENNPSELNLPCARPPPAPSASATVCGC